MAKQWKQWQTFLGAPKSLQMVTAAMKLKDAYSLKESYDQPRQHIKKQRHYFANKGPSSQGNGFPNSHVWMWELDCEESWAPKNWCFWSVVLEKTLESPLDCKKIQPVNPKGDQSVLIFHWKHWCWSWNSNTLVTWCKELTHVKRPWCWKRLKAGGKGDNRGFDGWMASLTQRTWGWVNSGSWWWTGRPGMLWSIGSQRVRYDWATELYWTESLITDFLIWVMLPLFSELKDSKPRRPLRPIPFFSRCEKWNPAVDKLKQLVYDRLRLVTWFLFGSTKSQLFGSMGSQRVGHYWATELDWATELNWTDITFY